MDEHFNPEKFFKQVQEEQRQFLQHLESALQVTNAENAFVTLVLFLVTRWCAEPNDKGSTDPQPAMIEFAAFHLFPHFGNTIGKDPIAIGAIIALLEDLQVNLTQEGMFSSKAEADYQLAQIQSHLRLHLEGVRGSAYPDQTREEIENIQGPFEDWFRHQIGIGPRCAVELLTAIEEQQNRNFHASRDLGSKVMESETECSPEKLNNLIEDEKKRAEALKTRAFVQALSSIAETFPVLREQLAGITSPPTEDEWKALIQLIGFTVEERKKITNRTEVKPRPLFVLPGDRVLFVDYSSIFDELFSAFDRVARRDQKFYDRHYHKRQKEWMEERIGDYFRRLFPDDAVFVGVVYPNPDKPGDEAELDVAVRWGPFLLLVEAKGCQFRMAAAQADLGRLRTDLQKNIHDAFEQANRATRYFQSTPTAIFKQTGTGKKLVVSRDEIRRVFKLSVTLHDLAGLTTQLANLKPLKLFTAGEYPFSVSLGDLEIITRFAESPDVFLHYIQRRLELQRSEKNIHSDELDLFGLYLDTRLDPNQFWDRKDDDGRDFTLMTLTGGSERFDKWKNAQQGIIPKAPEIKLALPSGIKDLLFELRCRNDNGARWIAFSLLNLSHKGVQRFENLLGQIRSQPLEPGNMRSVTFIDGELVAVITVGRMVTRENLRRTLFARVQVEHYRRKKFAALGFAIELNDPFKPFDSSMWIEGDWEYDPEMERIMQAMGPLKIAPGRVKPKPEEPCVCGSEEKFKNCCLPFFK